MNIIFLTGKLGSGKDTSAKIIIEYLKENGVKNIKWTTFVEPLKRMMVDYFLFTKEDFEDRKKKDKPHPLWHMSPREVLIAFTKRFTFSIFGKRVMEILMDSHLQKLEKEGVEYVIISDIRRVNEWTLLRNSGFPSIHLHIHRDDMYKGLKWKILSKTFQLIPPLYKLLYFFRIVDHRYNSYELIDFDKMSDEVISNKGSLDDLKSELEITMDYFIREL
jgi:hypothetical protein